MPKTRNHKNRASRTVDRPCPKSKKSTNTSGNNEKNMNGRDLTAAKDKEASAAPKDTNNMGGADRPCPKSKKNVTFVATATKATAGTNTNDSGVRKSSRRREKPPEVYKAPVPSTKPLNPRGRRKRPEARNNNTPKVIEKVLKKRRTADKAQYLIKWKDCPKSAATWQRANQKNYEHIKKFNIENNTDDDEDWEVEEILDKRISPRGRPEYLLKWKNYPESEASWTAPESGFFRGLINEYEERMEMGEEEDWEVEKVLKKRMRDGKPEYLLKWKGFATGDSTWENPDSGNFQELIQEFEERQAGKEPEPGPSTSTSKEASQKKSTIVHEEKKTNRQLPKSKRDQEDSKKNKTKPTKNKEDDEPEPKDIKVEVADLDDVETEFESESD